MRVVGLLLEDGRGALGEGRVLGFELPPGMADIRRAVGSGGQWGPLGGARHATGRHIRLSLSLSLELVVKGLSSTCFSFTLLRVGHPGSDGSTSESGQGAATY